jgi:PAS domain S-box-containing protein
MFKIKKMSFFYGRSIRQRFIYNLIFVITIVMLLFFSVVIFYNVKAIENDLQNQLTDASRLAVANLPSALWDYHNEYVNDFVESLFFYKDVVFVRVITDGKIIKTKSYFEFQNKEFSFFKDLPGFTVRETKIDYKGSNIGLIQIAMTRNRIKQLVISNSSTTIFLLILIISAIILTNLVLTRKYLFDPLLKLEKSARLIADGNFEAKIDTSSSDEIGNLAKTFEQMIKNIKSITASRDELNREIFERKQAEDVASRFSHIFEDSLNEIYLFDVDTLKFTQVNGAAQHNLGYTMEELKQLTPVDIKPEFTAESFAKSLATLRNGEKKKIVFRTVHQRKDQSRYDVEVHLQFLSDEYKAVFFAIILDITEKLKLERQLHQAQKMESIGTLTGGIAHDFNNILGIIVGNTELALDDVPKWNSAHSSLEEIKKASLRAKSIVKQLLSFSRKADQQLQPIQIASVIKDALNFLRSTIPTTINIHPDIQTTDETILADPTQINQIIMNLCINASQAMDQTGGDLTVTVEKLTLDDNSARDYPGLKSGNHVKIMISDTGPGIDSKIIDQIFDPYFTTKEIGKGSGMGLAVVHGIVKSHSGAIAVDSSLGKGTKFSILFPLATEKPVVEAQANKDIPRGNETILFVDDEISIVKMVKRMFERLGYKVETATTPQDALELFRSNPDHFNLVITDMTMPQMTGVKLSQKLMDIRKDIPIIVCTGYSKLVDEEKAKELGLAAYVMKPIDMQETAQTIRKVLDRK